MTAIFRDDAAKRALEASYERFRAPIPGTESRWVTTRFGKTHVLVAGRPDAPPLVLLHGAMTGSAQIMCMFTSLLDRFRIYAPDILGHSAKSIDARIPYDGASCGEWLSDVLDAFGLERAHVYGASLGGFMAHQLAQYAPDRIDRLVLLVPAGIINGSFFTNLAKFSLPMLGYRVFPSRERLVRLVDAMMTTRDDAWTDYFGEALRGFRLDLRLPPLASAESLVHFTRPTLVFGASDDIFFPGAELLARARVLFPHAETELLEACRHAPPTTGAFAARHEDRLVRFLTATEQRLSARAGEGSLSRRA